jgi:hypothetical protein
MVSSFVRKQKDIIEEVGLYKAAIAEMEKRYTEAQTGWREGKYTLTDRNLMIDGLMKRNLMIDGLMKRFVEQIDET